MADLKKIAEQLVNLTVLEVKRKLSLTVHQKMY